jgi:threonine dehydrogenase-like Zn-dependent dehydrogenase
VGFTCRSLFEAFADIVLGEEGVAQVHQNEAYVVVDTDETIGRLIHNTAMHVEHVRDGFRRTDLGPGDKVVDVGCGPIGALTALSDLVGPRGIVVGVDVDQASLKHARAILDREAKESVRLVHANINAEPAAELL